MQIDNGSYYSYELLSLRLNSMISSKKMKASTDESLVLTARLDDYAIEDRNDRLNTKEFTKKSNLRKRKETLRRKKL